VQSPLTSIYIHPGSQRLVLFFIGLSHLLAMCLLFLSGLPLAYLLLLQAVIVLTAMANGAVRMLQSHWQLQLGSFNPDERQPSVRIFNKCCLGSPATKISQSSGMLLEASLLSHFYLPRIIILTIDVPRARWPLLLENYRPWQRRLLRVSLFLSNLGRSRYHFILTAPDAQGPNAEAMRCLRSRLKTGRW